MKQFRNTVQKEQIYSALLELANHPTADDVYDYVRVDYPKISRATVYRVLNQMADNKVVTRIEIPGSAAHFDHHPYAHNHVRCVECGRVCDVEGEVRVEVDYSALHAPDFKIFDHNLIFDGLCRQCEEK
ncbi:MAG: Fur family transcriptional regulator [Clostridia bacterium]